MAITANGNVGIRQQLIDYTSKLKNETIAKTIVALAAIVAGVAAIVFLNASFAAAGIGLILIAAVAIYQYSKHYHQSKKIFMRAASNLE